MFIRKSLFQLLLLKTILIGSVLFISAGSASGVVNETVRLDTPLVVDGEVWDIKEVGNYIVVAGNFTQVQVSRDGEIVEQAGIFSYEKDSGIFNYDFRPTLYTSNPDKPVEVKAIVPDYDGKSFYFGGRFTQIDDGSDDKIRERSRIAKMSVIDGRLDRNFARSGVDSKVLALELVDDFLYVGGNFMSVYSFDVGRPPVTVETHSFIRVDAFNGAYDASFNFTPENSLERRSGISMLGVTNLGAVPDSNKLVLTHRGGELRNNVTGEVFDSPGVSILDVETGTVTGFKALSPTSYPMYHYDICGGRGIFIRDMEVSPDGTYFVVVHQGHDTGWACDTAVKYSITDAPTEPDWVHRVFDSVFSVAIDQDAIYIGGHFRYMVHESAPSPYPGNQPNSVGVVSPYNAGQTQVGSTFWNHLLGNGYVYQAQQIGVINPETGKGISSWNVTSDAYKCVCSLTVIDRGLLIGQDRSRISGFEVGRSGFLDNNPDTGNTQCQIEVSGNTIQITWVDIGDVQEWRIIRSGVFLDSVQGNITSYTDDTIQPNIETTYELKFNRNNTQNQIHECGTVTLEAENIFCMTNDVTHESFEISWNHIEASEYRLRIDDVWYATTENNMVTVTDVASNQNYEIEIQAYNKGNLISSGFCNVSTENLITECSVETEGRIVLLNFNGDDFNRVTVRKNDVWQNTFNDKNTYTEHLDPGFYQFEIIGFKQGEAFPVLCEPITIP